MKKIAVPVLIASLAFFLGSCAAEEINTEFSVTSQPLFLIPAKAISCYSKKTTAPGETPAQDVEESYFQIPTFTFSRPNPTNDLIIASISISYVIPSAAGTSSEPISCVFGGDQLRALDSRWFVAGVTEAVIPAGQGTTALPFKTDCPAYCGGIKSNLKNFSASGNIEIFGLERAANGDETPVRLQGFITIQSF